MITTAKKKLTLNKESVRVLVPSELGQVQGGRHHHRHTVSSVHPQPTSTATPSFACTVSSVRPTATA
jgi:hypothetical protein